mmetsp:Transcript_76004/g.211129  ORF Transcript_76004/g.211129 Transcript_76004/m.211129 type:complete len:301 (+) Transcript_76004:67-969(+)
MPTTGHDGHPHASKSIGSADTISEGAGGVGPGGSGAASATLASVALVTSSRSKRSTCGNSWGARGGAVSTGPLNQSKGASSSSTVPCLLPQDSCRPPVLQRRSLSSSSSKPQVKCRSSRARTIPAVPRSSEAELAPMAQSAATEAAPPPPVAPARRSPKPEAIAPKPSWACSAAWPSCSSVPLISRARSPRCSLRSAATCGTEVAGCAFRVGGAAAHKSWPNCRKLAPMAVKFSCANSVSSCARACATSANFSDSVRAVSTTSTECRRNVSIAAEASKSKVTVRTSCTTCFVSAATTFEA